MNRDRPRFIFGFLAVFGAAPFMARPEPNPAQAIFWLVMIGTGRSG